MSKPKVHYMPCPDIETKCGLFVLTNPDLVDRLSPNVKDVTCKRCLAIIEKRKEKS